MLVLFAQTFEVCPSPSRLRRVAQLVFFSHDWSPQRTSLVASWICSIIDDVELWFSLVPRAGGEGGERAWFQPFAHARNYLPFEHVYACMGKKNDVLVVTSFHCCRLLFTPRSNSMRNFMRVYRCPRSTFAVCAGLVLRAKAALHCSAVQECSVNGRIELYIYREYGLYLAMGYRKISVRNTSVG